MPAVLLVWSTKPDDTKMLLDILFPLNHVIIDQLVLNLVNICLDNTLQISCKSFLCSAKIGKIDYSTIAKIWLIKFSMFNFKIAYLTQFSTDFNHLNLKV